MFLSPGCHTGRKVALVSGAEYTTGVGVGSVARVLWEGERLEAWGLGERLAGHGEALRARVLSGAATSGG